SPSHHGASDPLEALLYRGEMFDVLDRAGAHDHVRLAGEDRGDQLGDVGGVVLVVGIGVHDDVRANLRDAANPAWKAAGRALVVGRRTKWSTPVSPAALQVRSVEASTITSPSAAAIPL